MSQARKERGFVAVSQLIQMFPAAFDRFDRKPLKLGIHDDLLAREIASDVVRAGLRSYCNAAGYLSGMKAGAARIDLDGNPASVVTAEDAEHAARKLAEAAERAKQARINQTKAVKEEGRRGEKEGTRASRGRGEEGRGRASSQDSRAAAARSRNGHPPATGGRS